MRIVRIGAVSAVLLAVGVAPLGASAATPAWRVQKAKAPKGVTDTYFNGVSCTSPTACTAVGEHTTNFTSGGSTAEFWNGTSWKIQKTPSATTYLAGVSCTSVSQCIAVGNTYDQSTLSTGATAAGWNGTKWAAQKVKAPKGSSSSMLGGVSCPSATTCIAVGQSQGATGTASLAASWNGAKWALLKAKTPTGSPSAPLNAVSCTSPTACIAVGQAYLPGGTDSQALAEVWNGSTWTIRTVPTPAGGVFATLNGVSCPSATQCIAVGYYHQGTSSGPLATLAEVWNGSTWAMQTTPAVVATLSSVSCASTSACTAVGFGSPAVTPTAMSWDGVTWTLQGTPTPAGTSNPTFTGVSCTASTACTAVGSDNLASGHLQFLVERYS